MRQLALLIAACTMVLTATADAQQDQGAKLALVVGISEYEDDAAARRTAGLATPANLANAVGDSVLVADALATKGFSVARLANPDRRAMLVALNTLARQMSDAGPGTVAVFYFAGHGAQGRPVLERDIDNYLIPVGADLFTETDLESEAIGLSRISETLRPGDAGATVIILDACRDFALPAASRTSMATRGLAEARAAPGTIIAYATSPGKTALDGSPGQNGFYARALAREIRAAQGARIEDVFIAVRNMVLVETRQLQLPWENGSLRRAVTLGVAPDGGARVAADPTALDALTWRGALNAGSLNAFRDYLLQYPNGRFAVQAQQNIERLQRLAAPPALTPQSPDGRVQSGQTYSGELRRGDQQLQSGEYIDRYTLSARQGEQFVVTATSSAFDPYLMARGPGGLSEDNDDADQSTKNARLEITASSVGDIVISLTSYAPREAGAYTLKIETGYSAKTSDINSKSAEPRV